MSVVIKVVAGAAALIAGLWICYFLFVESPRKQQKDEYDACMVKAAAMCESAWNAKCLDLKSAAKQLMTTCLADKEVMSHPNLGESFCREKAAALSPSEDCSLPGRAADMVKGQCEAEEDKCLLRANLSP